MTTKQIIISAASVGLAVAFGVTAFAQTTATPSPVTTATKITCVGTAVNAREKAIDAAITTYTSSINSAYSARATALQQAYTQTTSATVKTAVKKAWSDFTKTAKTARQTWQTARNSAWSQFRKDAATCKPTAGISDSANSGLEASGQ